MSASDDSMALVDNDGDGGEDRRPLHETWGIWIAAGGVVCVLTIFVVLGYLAFSTRTLLTNGKTTSAKSAAATKVIVQKIHIQTQAIETALTKLNTLIAAGKSAGALDSARAAQQSAAGLVILHQAESLFLNAIAANHQTGLQNHAILCSYASTFHDNSPTVRAYCSTK